MSKKLFINSAPCTSCMNCMAACAQGRAGSADRNAAAIRVEDHPFDGGDRIDVCRQCDNAPCAAACPAGAIIRDEGLGAWVISREACLRCGTCVDACPFDAMQWWDERHGPVKCDLCGGAPRCAEACHFGVIQFSDPADKTSRHKGIPVEDLDPMLGRG